MNPIHLSNQQIRSFYLCTLDDLEHYKKYMGTLAIMWLILENKLFVFTTRSKFAISIAYLQVEDYFEMENLCAKWRSSSCYCYSVYLDRAAVFRVKNRTRHLNIGLSFYEGWNFNSGNYLFTTDTK